MTFAQYRENIPFTPKPQGVQKRITAVVDLHARCPVLHPVHPGADVSKNIFQRFAPAVVLGHDAKIGQAGAGFAMPVRRKRLRPPPHPNTVISRWGWYARRAVSTLSAAAALWA